MTRLKRTNKNIPADLEVLSRRDVASALGRSIRTVDRLIESNALGSVRWGRSVGVTTAQLREFLAKAQTHHFDAHEKSREILGL